MKVSVILPIYNGEQTLDETLRSLVAQSYRDFELVACIDGTEDGSEDILKSYRKDFPKLIVLKNKRNLGLGPTMNRLVANSNGEYIAVAEQDDYYYPNRLQLQVELMDSNTDVGMSSGIAEFWNGQKVTSQFPGILVHGGQYPEGEEMFLLNYRKQIKVVNSCMMFRKSVHIDNGLYFTKHYPSISVDWTYVLRFSLVSKIYGMHNILVRLDRRPNRTSVTTFQERKFAATRELLRSFAYEYPEIISKRDYKYALRTQLSMEINHTTGIKYIFSSIKNMIIYPREKRFKQSFVKRINWRK